MKRVTFIFFAIAVGNSGVQLSLYLRSKLFDKSASNGMQTSHMPPLTNTSEISSAESISGTTGKLSKHTSGGVEGGSNEYNDGNRNSNKTYALTKKDITRPGWIWDASPIVIESHKLIFFTVPKVGCTVFKQLFRRMDGYQNWKTKYPHDPRTNGLTYMNKYSIKESTRMMNSNEWTKAIFVRDPKEKFLSAYLDKVRKLIITKNMISAKDKIMFIPFTNVTIRCLY